MKIEDVNAGQYVRVHHGDDRGPGCPEYENAIVTGRTNPRSFDAEEFGRVYLNMLDGTTYATHSSRVELLEPSDFDYAVASRQMMNLVPVGPLTKDEQEGLDWYEAYCEATERECGSHISTGGFDPYGTSCDLDAGHDGPHEGPDFFGNGRLRWTGGGSCAGDPLPYAIIDHS